ncbi:ImmA/IrrE family metallo-endopeptidase [Singulisphaera sp. GP187]|uniref:ImmA/IrrE family metallo-endopeptidase n=1 Tax=Singulisphaera sp. GP187 TaxID=1882752 RepID=UPI001C1F26BF|nr:ImmA/IrrE family metallo-endopeptidase [Singulisphaera sp. GP187]
MKERTARDIDGQVAKILQGLGNPDPPIRLEDVRDLLSLDLRYFSSTDDGLIRELAHNMRVAGKQILLRPTLLLDAIKTFKLAALYLPDRKRIMIDSSMPPIKQRWGYGHEIGHSIIPWHNNYMLGDDQQTLTPACHEQLESEANYAAARILFMQGKFESGVSASSLNFSQVKALSKAFGNSMTTTLWRVVDFLDIPAIGVISGHPKRILEDFDPANPCKYFIRSKPFCVQFDHLSETDLFAIISGYCKYSKKGPLGSEEVELIDRNGKRHVFLFETFHNSYDALTLGVYRRPGTFAISPCTH